MEFNIYGGYTLPACHVCKRLNMGYERNMPQNPDLTGVFIFFTNALNNFFSRKRMGN